MKDLLYKVNRRDNIAYGAIKVCECIHSVEAEEGDSEEDIFFSNMFDDQTATDIFNKKYDAIKIQINAYMAGTFILSITHVLYFAGIGNGDYVVYRSLYTGDMIIELMLHKDQNGNVQYTTNIVKDEEGN